MENQQKQIGRRIYEARAVLNLSAEEMANYLGVSVNEYLKHESGEIDSSFTFLYHCAQRFEIDISELVEGRSPHLSFFDVNYSGSGMPIQRREGFTYLHLAQSLKNRLLEPFVVTAKLQNDDAEIPLTTHIGNEFDYVLKGTLKVSLDGKIVILNQGDSITYDSSHPHGMIAIGNEDCEFLAIVTKHDQAESTAPIPQKKVIHADADNVGRDFIYRKFMTDTVDSEGHLLDVKFHYPNNFNFAYDVIDALKEKCPDKLAMLWIGEDFTERRFTFRDIAENSCRAANYLYSLGIRKGDRVMLVLKRHYQFWFILNALHRIGAVAIPASCQLLAKDYIYRFHSANVKAVICSPDGDIADNAGHAADQCPEVRLRIMVNGSRDGWLDFDAEMSKFSAKFKRDPALKCTDTSIIFFSSGTTGYPKMVCHSFTYPLGHIITARYWHCVDPDGLHLSISDTGWGKALWGKIYGQWLCESAVFTYDFDRFHASNILSLFAKYHITTLCAPPTMYRFFIKEDLSKYDLSGLKHATIAGEALNPEVFYQFYKATGLKVMEGFGQTESTLLIANLDGMTPKPGSMGKPTPQFTIDLFGHDGKPVKAGEVGEIVVKAEPQQVCGIFQKYDSAPDKTAEVWHDGWYHTGDTAWKDEDGYFWYVGRVDDLIKSSGYRIGPFEIESVLMELPYVLECAVTGIPDPTRGQVVKASIVLVKGTEGSEALKKEIQEYVKEHTAPYKYPRVVEFLSELPKTSSGKIRRVDLRKA